MMWPVNNDGAVLDDGNEVFTEETGRKPRAFRPGMNAVSDTQRSTLTNTDSTCVLSYTVLE